MFGTTTSFVRSVEVFDTLVGSQSKKGAKQNLFIQIVCVLMIRARNEWI